jgi:hypothetical protein
VYLKTPEKNVFRLDGWTDLHLGLDDGGLAIRAFDKADATGSPDQLIKTEALLPFSPKVRLLFILNFLLFFHAFMRGLAASHSERVICNFVVSFRADR